MEARNMRNLQWILILILTLGLSFACSTAKNTGTTIKEGTTEAAEEVGDKAEDVGQEVEDGSITSAIKMKFANDEQVSASAIDVDTNNGDVTLNGTVSSQAEADRAVELAKTVSGVKSVKSNLTIKQ
jgi:hyperosmotically inducible periplasmic protein